MTEILKVRVDRRDGLAVVYTEGYINNQGGEEIAREAYSRLEQGVRALVLNLEKTRIVNSIGISILIEVLDAGYVHVDVGTPDEMYIWPYFARYPLDKLTPPQLVELFKLVFAGDYEDMLADGVYSYFSAGISPDGTWRYFQSGD